VYDHPFELHVGDYAFAYLHEFPNEILALFTEQDRRSSAELEASEPEILETEKVDSDYSEFTKPDRLNPIGDEANRDTPDAEQVDPGNLDVMATDRGNPTPGPVGLEEAGVEEVDPEDLDAEESHLESAYEVPVSVMRERLEILGFSNALWEEELQDYVKERSSTEYGTSSVEKKALLNDEELLGDSQSCKVHLCNDG